MKLNMEFVFQSDKIVKANIYIEDNLAKTKLVVII